MIRVEQAVAVILTPAVAILTSAVVVVIPWIGVSCLPLLKVLEAYTTS